MFFGLFVIFILWFSYERYKANRDSSYTNESFWEKERRASYVPTANIDSLPYVYLDESVLPVPRPDDPDELVAVLDSIRELKGVKMIDLSEYTNTDLKLKYGTFNFPELSKADTNFAELMEYCEKASDILSGLSRNEDAYKLVDYAARLSGSKKLADKAHTLHNFMTN